MPGESVPKVPMVNSDAPIVYFDGAPNFGFNAGIGNVTLEALRFADDNQGGVSAERVAVAHLRANLLGIQALHEALGRVLLMAQPTEGQAN